MQCGIRIAFNGCGELFYGRRGLLQIVFGVFTALRQRMITLRDITAGVIQRL
ncbi:hypothetical protein [Candidatus Symbiopectobacterium sp.]|uniref:hypothetical protein n=1 Tax=Candidatus Symbiopectobacterium sp. TaxID=2816440 RepID=UPI0025BB4B5C|nr:hypothetical protein [Candidatus Symbiopectobacterium sp.]